MFNAIPLAGFVFRNLDLFHHADEFGGGGLGDELGTGDNVGDEIGQQIDNIPFTPDPRVIGNESFDDLVGELRNNSIRFSEDNIVKITRGFDGKIYWLESGNSGVGLEHIINGHQDDFERVLGINSAEDISNLIINTINVQSPTRIVQESRGFAYHYSIPSRSDLELIVAVGDNGFIVTSYFKRIQVRGH